MFLSVGFLRKRVYNKISRRGFIRCTGYYDLRVILAFINGEQKELNLSGWNSITYLKDWDKV